MGKRLESVDVAKGIAIICIVAGHLGFKGINGVDNISQFVFQFHVPIFFIIAGYFLTTKKSIMAFVVQKAKRLLIPYLITCVIMFVVLLVWKLAVGTLSATAFGSLKQFVIAAFYGAGSNGAHLPEGITQIGAIWFLEALFVALVEVRCCLNCGRYAFIPIMILFTLSIISSNHIWLPFNIQSGFAAGFYVYLGHIICVRKIPSINTPVPLLLATFTISALAYYSSINVSLVRIYLGPFFLGLPVSISSSCLIIMLSDYLTRKNTVVKRFLAWFGANSLDVLCVHIVLLNCGLGYILSVVGVPTENNILFSVMLGIHLAASAVFIMLTKRWS